MNILMDTHIFLWALSDPSRLSKEKRLALEDLSNTIHVSAISIAELTIKASIGRFTLDFDPVAIAEDSGFSFLDFNAASALMLKDLPFHHKDPFDRMLIAQSMTHDDPLMTEDPKIHQYDCRIVPPFLS